MLMKFSAKDRIKVYPEDGCWSYVGKIGNEQSLSLGRGCEAVSIAAHEIGHALGFFHTMSRHDRNEYVTVNTANIKPDWFDHFTKETTRTNYNYVWHDVRLRQYNALHTVPEERCIAMDRDQRQAAKSAAASPPQVSLIDQGTDQKPQHPTHSHFATIIRSRLSSSKTEENKDMSDGKQRCCPVKRRKQDFALRQRLHLRTKEYLIGKLDNFSKKIDEELEEVKTVISIHIDEIEREVRSLRDEIRKLKLLHLVGDIKAFLQRMILLECEIERSFEEIGVNQGLERCSKKLELLTELRKTMDTTSTETQA
ncbi:unnamed protein product [Heligmosomoides polygyrus]|uniref:Metalloendopeptidase n=1 Tax=Heligmosomoides polygyrus TaxID=6339 RepID=A0A183GK97_HELPZ|nr:unnamed protein product [Heligmosomoides polygyrus]